MIYKFAKAMKNRVYTLGIVSSRFFWQNIFEYSKEYRSDSENGEYLSAVCQAIQNQKAFDNFKRSYSYRRILEHVSKDIGLQYLEILKSRDDGILKKGIATVLVSDQVGNPIKHQYDGFDALLSPTTLRYLKVASDLRIMFGEQLGNVAEIGCGYGGQTLVNDQLLDVNLAKLFDLSLVNKLVERYLNSFLLRGAYSTTVVNKEMPCHYDLVLSNYAFSELPKKLQIAYIDKVLSKSERGYLTMNSGLGGSRSVGKLSVYELRELLPSFDILEENPQTSSYNYIIVWGHNVTSTKKNFKFKQLCPDGVKAN